MNSRATVWETGFFMTKGGSQIPAWQYQIWGCTLGHLKLSYRAEIFCVASEDEYLPLFKVSDRSEAVNLHFSLHGLEPKNRQFKV